jgi:hypothetical protein
MFNLVMLGKQGWRLINNPDSLCARVLKGHYYHDSDFLAATRRKHASQTWREILAGRDVLQKGLVRRIGDGQTTNIWHDRWIPNHFDGTPLVVPDDPQLTTVSELITPSGAWNEGVIKHTFADIDAHAILSTPIRGTGHWSRHLEVGARETWLLLCPIGIQDHLQRTVAAGRARKGLELG